jgi:hypothetical protein
MELTLAQVAIHKSAYNPDTVLDPWRWRLGEGFAVLLPTVFGHLFLERADGTVWFLDTWTGDLHEVGPSYDSFRTAVSADQEFCSRWFLPALIVELRNAGLVLAPGQCYAPFVSPGVGGSTTPANFTTASLRLHLATSAAEVQQLHGGPRPDEPNT